MSGFAARGEGRSVHGRLRCRGEKLRGSRTLRLPWWKTIAFLRRKFVLL